MRYKDFEIIDFHTHPFWDDKNNICSHIAHCNMSADGTKKVFENLGVSRICGSVLTTGENWGGYVNARFLCYLDTFVFSCYNLL